MHSKFIIGCEPWLSIATKQWADVDNNLELILCPLSLNKEYKLDFDPLSSLDQTSGTAFVAWGNDFLNFQRWEIYGALKQRGFKCPPLIHPSANLPLTVSIGENTWIAENVTICNNTAIGINTTVREGTFISQGSIVKKNSWIGINSHIGIKAQIENHTVIGDSIIVRDFISIGKYCIFEQPTTIEKNVPAKSFCFLASNLRGYIIDYT